MLTCIIVINFVMCSHLSCLFQSIRQFCHNHQCLGFVSLSIQCISCWQLCKLWLQSFELMTDYVSGVIDHSVVYFNLFYRNHQSRGFSIYHCVVALVVWADEGLRVRGNWSQWQDGDTDGDHWTLHAASRENTRLQVYRQRYLHIYYFHMFIYCRQFICEHFLTDILFRAADHLKILIAQSLHAQENDKNTPPQQMTSYIPYICIRWMI